MKTILTIILLAAMSITAAAQRNKTDTLYKVNAKAYHLKQQGQQMLIGGAAITAISGAFLGFTRSPNKTIIPIKKTQRLRQISTASIGIAAGVAVMIIGYSKLHKAGISIKGNGVAINL